jgi:hypothetical protein
MTTTVQLLVNSSGRMLAADDGDKDHREGHQRSGSSGMRSGSVGSGYAGRNPTVAGFGYQQDLRSRSRQWLPSTCLLSMATVGARYSRQMTGRLWVHLIAMHLSYSRRCPGLVARGRSRKRCSTTSGRGTSSAQLPPRFYANTCACGLLPATWR